MPRALRPYLLAMLAIAAIIGFPSAASATDPIGAGQDFKAVFNDTNTQYPTVFVVCPGVSSYGYARAGQKMKVTEIFTLATSSVLGYTGSGASTIGVSFTYSGATPTSVFHAYDVDIPVPTNILFPCGGHQIVYFTPTPFTATSVQEALNVDFDIVLS